MTGPVAAHVGSGALFPDVLAGFTRIREAAEEYMDKRDLAGNGRA